MAETNKQHWAQHHRDLAADQDEEIKCHQDAMGKAVAGDPMHSYHKGMIAKCTKVRDRETAKAEKCDKADEGDDLNKSAAVADLVKREVASVVATFEKRLTTVENAVVPTNISAVAPTAPGLRAVPRYGAQPLPERPNVPVQFEHLVKVEE